MTSSDNIEETPTRSRRARRSILVATLIVGATLLSAITGFGVLNATASGLKAKSQAAPRCAPSRAQLFIFDTGDVSAYPSQQTCWSWVRVSPNNDGTKCMSSPHQSNNVSQKYWGFDDLNPSRPASETTRLLAECARLHPGEPAVLTAYRPGSNGRNTFVDPASFGYGAGHSFFEVYRRNETPFASSDLLNAWRQTGRSKGAAPVVDIASYQGSDLSTKVADLCVEARGKLGIYSAATPGMSKAQAAQVYAGMEACQARLTPKPAPTPNPTPTPTPTPNGVTLPGDASVLGRGDSTGDGVSDEILFAKSNGGVYVRAGGTGQIFLFDTYYTRDWDIQLVGDFNGDGKIDLASYATINGTWWVGISKGRSFETTKWADFATLSGWIHREVGDFNHDGRADIRQYYPGNKTWWYSYSTGSGFHTVKV